MDLRQIGLDLGACIQQVVVNRRDNIRQTIGTQDAIVDLNLLVLYNWVTTWRISDLLPAQFAKPILDAMSEPMFDSLIGSGLRESDAEAFVHQRYAEYYNAIKTMPGGEALQHIAGCFAGFCNSDPSKRGQFFSLDIVKTMPIAIELGSFSKAIQESLVELVKQHS